MPTKVGVLRLSRETLQALLTKALARDWTPSQAAILAQTDNIESVRQAVQRVSLRSSTVRACTWLGWSEGAMWRGYEGWCVWQENGRGGAGCSNVQ